MAAVYERDGEWWAVPRPVPLARVVRGALLNALAYTDGHQGHAAALLEITPRQLGYQLRGHGIPTDAATRAPKRLRLVRRRRTA